MEAGDPINQQQFGSSGLSQAQQRYSAQVPRKILPSTSGNGMSTGQYEATLGGSFPVRNGIANDQYQTAKYTMREGM